MKNNMKNKTFTRHDFGFYDALIQMDGEVLIENYNRIMCNKITSLVNVYVTDADYNSSLYRSSHVDWNDINYCYFSNDLHRLDSTIENFDATIVAFVKEQLGITKNDFAI